MANELGMQEGSGHVPLPSFVPVKHPRHVPCPVHGAPRAPHPTPTLMLRSSEAEAKVLVSLGLKATCGWKAGK